MPPIDGNEYELEVQSLITKWKGRLNLNDWKVVLSILPSKKMRGKLAHVEVWPEEERVALKVIEKSGFENDHRTLNEIVCHELVHVIVDPMAPKRQTEVQRDNEEKVVNKITRGILEAYDEK